MCFLFPKSFTLSSHHDMTHLACPQLGADWSHHDMTHLACPQLGADCKNKQTTKQLNNFIWTNRKVDTKLDLLPIGLRNTGVWQDL